MSDEAAKPVGVETYFLALQAQLSASLGLAHVIPHPGGKGDEAEANWFELLSQHLPRRYQPIAKCHVVDHLGNNSQEIDLVLCDRQYSTMVLAAESRLLVPAESVYAVFEVKPRLNRGNVLYAADKAASVRGLDRTNAPIVAAGGRIDEPKEPGPIIAGLLTVESDWSPDLGDSFVSALEDQHSDGRLDLGCVLTHGGWAADYARGSASFFCSVDEHALVSFYLTLLGLLQEVGTVPAMDVGQWGDFLRYR